MILFVNICGCQKTPAGVRKGMDNYLDNRDKLSADIRYINVCDLKNERISNCKVKNNNLILPKDVYVTNIDDVYLLEGFYNKLQDTGLVMKSLGLADSGKWTKESEGAYDIYVNDSISKIYVAFSSRGELSYIYEPEDDWVDDVSKRDIKIYGNEESSLRDDLLKKTADIYDQVRFTKKFEVIPEKISHSKVKGNQLKEYNYLLEYKGLPLSSFSMDDRKNELFYITNYFKVMYYEDGTVKRIALRNPFEIRKEKKQNKVVSLQSAVDLVSKKLSGFGKVKISEIRLEYAVYKKYGNSTKVKARPVYTFRVRTTEKNEKDAFAYFSIRVDMVTGKITDDLGVNGLKIAK